MHTIIVNIEGQKSKRFILMNPIINPNPDNNKDGNPSDRLQLPLRFSMPQENSEEAIVVRYDASTNTMVPVPHAYDASDPTNSMIPFLVHSACDSVSTMVPLPQHSISNASVTVSTMSSLPQHSISNTGVTASTMASLPPPYLVSSSNTSDIIRRPPPVTQCPAYNASIATYTMPQPSSYNPHVRAMRMPVPQRSAYYASDAARTLVPFPQHSISNTRVTASRTRPPVYRASSCNASATISRMPAVPLYSDYNATYTMPQQSSYNAGVTASIIMPVHQRLTYNGSVTASPMTSFSQISSCNEQQHSHSRMVPVSQCSSYNASGETSTKELLSQPASCSNVVTAGMLMPLSQRSIYNASVTTSTVTSAYELSSCNASATINRTISMPQSSAYNTSANVTYSTRVPIPQSTTYNAGLTSSPRMTMPKLKAYDGSLRCSSQMPKLKAYDSALRCSSQIPKPASSSVVSMPGLPAYETSINLESKNSINSNTNVNITENNEYSYHLTEQNISNLQVGNGSQTISDFGM